MNHIARHRSLYTAEARRLLAAGNPRQAAELCKHGLIHFPEDHTGYVLLADAFLALGEYDRALGVLADGYRRTGSSRLNALRAAVAAARTAPAASAASAVDDIPSPEELAADLAAPWSELLEIREIDAQQDPGFTMPATAERQPEPGKVKNGDSAAAPAIAEAGTQQDEPEAIDAGEGADLQALDQLQAAITAALTQVQSLSMPHTQTNGPSSAAPAQTAAPIEKPAQPEPAPDVPDTGTETVSVQDTSAEADTANVSVAEAAPDAPAAEVVEAAPLDTAQAEPSDEEPGTKEVEAPPAFIEESGTDGIVETETVAEAEGDTPEVVEPGTIEATVEPEATGTEEQQVDEQPGLEEVVTSETVEAEADVEMEDAEPEDVEPEAIAVIAEPETVEPEEPIAETEPEEIHAEETEPAPASIDAETVSETVDVPEAAEAVTAEAEPAEPQVAEPEVVAAETESGETSAEEVEASPASVDTEITPEAAEPEATVEPEAAEVAHVEPEAVEPEAAVEPETAEVEHVEPEAVEAGISMPEPADGMPEPETVQAEERTASDTETVTDTPVAAGTEKPEAEIAAAEPVSEMDAASSAEIAPVFHEQELQQAHEQNAATVIALGTHITSPAQEPEVEAAAHAVPEAPAAGVIPAQAEGPAAAEHNEPRTERPRTLALALHTVKNATRLRSSNLRLIPGLEFAPLRHEDNTRRQSIAPLINEPMPQPELPRRTAAPASSTMPPLPELSTGHAAPALTPMQYDTSGMPETGTRGGVLGHIGREDIAFGDEPLSPLEELARQLEGARIPAVEEAEQRAEFEPSLMSETFANILAAQGAYAEALAAYRLLAQASPERAGHFQQKIDEMQAHLTASAAESSGEAR